LFGLGIGLARLPPGNQSVRGRDFRKKGWHGDEVYELREEKWEIELRKLLRRARKTQDEVLAAPKSAA